MTAKEAIMILESIQPSCGKYSYSESEIYEAIDMAIEVLECSEIPNCSDCIDRAEAQTAIQFAARRYTVAHEAHGEGHVVWSDNLISVTDAMNALREVSPAQPSLVKESGDLVKDLVKDTISRQDAIDAMWDALHDYKGEYDERSSYGVLCDVEKKLMTLQSAQPERKKGYMKIKVISAVDGEGLFCENCDAYCLSPLYNFCPKCGVEFIGVRGKQDEQENNIS